MGRVTGSLLVMETICDTGAESQLSEAKTFSVTGSIWWFFWETTLGVDVKETMVGAVESTTLKFTVQLALFWAASATVTLTA